MAPALALSDGDSAGSDGGDEESPTAASGPLSPDSPSPRSSLVPIRLGSGGSSRGVDRGGDLGASAAPLGASAARSASDPRLSERRARISARKKQQKIERGKYAARHKQRRANHLDIHKELLSGGQWQRCPRCQSQTTFCAPCAAKFDEMVPVALCRQLAFGPDVEREFQQMFEDLSSRVDEKSAQNRTSEVFPGSTQTSRQRRATRARVLDGLRIDNITQNIERDKREKSGLLVAQSPIDVMPAEAVQWLAGIDDATRSWLFNHNERIERHDKWLKSNLVDREITHQDDRINIRATFPGVATLSLHAIKRRDLGRPTATTRLPPTLTGVRARIEDRARFYVARKS